MVSDSELLDLLGTHIGIYPFIDNNVEGASVFLTASNFAWSKDSKKTIIKNDSIIIPPKDTGIILTAEAISLDGYVSGICISRVSQTVKGLILPSTPIKPGWTGRMIIAIYNTTNNAISINIGERIAVVMFSKLNKKAILEDTRKSRSDILTYIGITPSQEQAEKLKSALNDRNYVDPNSLMRIMEESEDYLKFKKRKKGKFDLILLLLVLCILFFITSLILYILFNENNKFSGFLLVLIPVFLSAAITFTIKKWIE